MLFPPDFNDELRANLITPPVPDSADNGNSGGLAFDWYARSYPMQDRFRTAEL
jgi:hypothetical protein